MRTFKPKNENSKSNVVKQESRRWRHEKTHLNSQVPIKMEVDRRPITPKENENFECETCKKVG